LACCGWQEFWLPCHLGNSTSIHLSIPLHASFFQANYVHFVAGKIHILVFQWG
jgi:hypothetical protein